MSDEHHALEMEGEAGALEHWWWAAVLAAMVTGAALLLAAGAALAHADLGTELRARGCSGSPLAALALFVGAGFAIALAPKLARLRHGVSRIVLDPGALLVAAPVPAVLLALALPGLLGCRAATRIADVALVGGALVGAPGIAVAAASSLALGVALSAVVQVPRAQGAGDGPAEPPSIIELAIAEAEAREAERDAEQFRGIDPL